MRPATKGVINQRLRGVASFPWLPYKDEQGSSYVHQQMYLPDRE